MKELGIGVIGYGDIGKVHASVINKIEGAKLVAVANASDVLTVDRLYHCEYCIGYEDLLANPEVDVVTIALPSGLHRDATIAAAKAGKHVICEKPIDITVERAEEMVQACEEAGVMFSIVMQHRFDTPYVALQRAIKEEKLGEILWGSARVIWHRTREYYDNGWRGTIKYENGGALTNQSVHYIDQLVNIMGDVANVSSMCRTLYHDIETEDIGVVNLEFENGTLGTIEGTTLSYPGIYSELGIYGSEGFVLIRNDKLFQYNFKSGKDAEFEELLDVEGAMAYNETPAVDPTSHQKQFTSFFNAVRGEGELISTGEEAKKVLNLIQTIYQASRERTELVVEND